MSGAHLLTGDRCDWCGQSGLELEDECPLSGGAKPTPPPARSAMQKRVDQVNSGYIAEMLHKRETPKRRSFNDVQNDDRLEMIAKVLMQRIPEAIKANAQFTGKDLKFCLTQYNMEARHTDQCDAGL